MKPSQAVAVIQPHVNSPKNVLIAVLALVSVTSSILVWQQYQRAQHSVVTVASNNDDLLKKLAAAERNSADLEARLAAFQSAPAPEASPAAPTETAANAERRGPTREQGPNNNRRAEMEALMSNPEVQKLMAEQQKAQLDGRYAALFKQLNLSPAQLEAFKNLILEKQNSQRDVMMAARENGLNPRESRDELRKLVSQANAETDAAIATAIGQEKFNQYKTYEATGTQRALVDQLGRTMSYSATPLNDSQSQALVQILAQNASTENAGNNLRGGGFSSGFGGPFGQQSGGRINITDAMINQAQSVLAPDQVKVLQDQQAAQQNEQKLRELMRPRAPETRP